MEEIREGVLSILEELHSDIDYEKETALVDGKVLDSFDLVTLVSELSEEFDINITAREFIPENFNTVDCIVKMVAKLMEE